MQSVNDIYSTEILPLSEDDRLRLAAMIMRDIRGGHGRGPNGPGGIRAAFGTWHGQSPFDTGYGELDHNEKIDLDLKGRGCGL